MSSRLKESKVRELMDLLLIRHGETRWNQERRYQGQSDVPLAPEGIAAARRLSARCKQWKLKALYASPLKRAHQTSQILGKSSGLKPKLDKRLQEIHFGLWEGKTFEELRALKDPRFQTWARGKWANPPKGEKLAVVQKRIRHFLKGCLKRHQGEKIAVVSHGVPIRLMLLEALGLGLDWMFAFDIHPASYAHLRFYPDRKIARLIHLNVYPAL